MKTVNTEVNDKDDEYGFFDRDQFSDKPLMLLRAEKREFYRMLAGDAGENKNGLWAEYKESLVYLEWINEEVGCLLTEAELLKNNPAYVVNEENLQIALLVFSTYRMTVGIKHEFVFTDADEMDVSKVLKELKHLEDAMETRIKKLLWEIRAVELHLVRTTASIAHWEKFNDEKPYSKDLFHGYLSPTDSELRSNRLTKQFLVNSENEYFNILQYCNALIGSRVNLFELGDYIDLDTKQAKNKSIIDAFEAICVFVEEQAALDYPNETELTLPGEVYGSHWEFKRVRLYAAFQDILSRVVAASEMAAFNQREKNANGAPIVSFKGQAVPPVSVDGASVLTGDSKRDRVDMKHMKPLESVLAACLLYSQTELASHMSYSRLGSLEMNWLHPHKDSLLDMVEKLFLYSHVDTQRSIDAKYFRNSDAFVTMLAEGAPEDWAYDISGEEV